MLSTIVKERKLIWRCALKTKIQINNLRNLLRKRKQTHKQFKTTSKKAFDTKYTHRLFSRLKQTILVCLRKINRHSTMIEAILCYKKRFIQIKIDKSRSILHITKCSLLKVNNQCRNFLSWTSCLKTQKIKKCFTYLLNFIRSTKNRKAI